MFNLISNSSNFGSLKFSSNTFFHFDLKSFNTDISFNKSEKYSFLNDKQVKKLAKLLDALVVASVSKYTDQQPEFQELKENMKKLVENEKEKAQQEEQ